MGLHDKILVVECYRVASVRSCEKLPPYPTEPMPVGSKTDTPLAKTNPISNRGSISVMKHI